MIVMYDSVFESGGKYNDIYIISNNAKGFLFT